MEADFQILVSIYNPNMLDAKIESGTAILSHKHTPVCTVRQVIRVYVLLPNIKPSA